MDVYRFTAKGIDGKEVALSKYSGKALLIVNVASQCGFTPQYEALEALYRKYRGQGLEVLGFPCNQFGSQESGSDQSIKEFCETKFGIDFPIFSKIDVNGRGAHPLFQYLVQALPGFFGTKRIKWNFTKFLVGRDGKPVKRYAPTVKPEALESDIQALLKK